MIVGMEQNNEGWHRQARSLHKSRAGRGQWSPQETQWAV